MGRCLNVRVSPWLTIEILAFIEECCMGIRDFTVKKTQDQMASLVLKKNVYQSYQEKKNSIGRNTSYFVKPTMIPKPMNT